MRGSPQRFASTLTNITKAQQFFCPEPWIWKHSQLQENWSCPSTIAISRSWKDVDAFCKHLLAVTGTPSSTNATTPFFIDIGIRSSVKNLNSYSSLPYEYILFGTLDAMMLVLHGYPKASPEMAIFGKLLRRGSLSKLYWSSELETSLCPYYSMTGKPLGKAWCNLHLFFQMLDVQTETKSLPDPLVALVNSSNIEMWKRSVPQYSSQRLLATPSKITTEDLQKAIASFFSRIALFRRIIRDSQPTILCMSEENEKEFSQYYLDDDKK